MSGMPVMLGSKMFTGWECLTSSFFNVRDGIL
jgi:hypothetical protein